MRLIFKLAKVLILTAASILSFSSGLVRARCRCLSDKPLDVVILLDTSDSMQPELNFVKANIADILRTLGQNSRFRVGLVIYGYDEPRSVPLCDDASRIMGAIAGVRAFGNYEPIDEALEIALEMNWRDKARKVIVLIGDEPPDSQTRTNGIARSYELATRARERGIIVSTICTADSGKRLPEFDEIARRGGGESLLLTDVPKLKAALLRLSLGYTLEWEKAGAARVDFGAGTTLIVKLVPSGAFDYDEDDIAELLRSMDLLTRFSWRKMAPHEFDFRPESAPFLYISGHGEISLTGDLKSRLKSYLTAGGYLIADDCCGNREFDASFRRLIAELFGEDSLKPLSRGNAVYYEPSRISEAVPRRVLGVEIGCRTAVVYFPFDLSCCWSHGPDILRKFSDKDAFGLGGNFLHRAMLYNDIVKAAKPLVPMKSHAAGETPIGQLRFNGFWNPPAHALERVFAELSRGTKIVRYAVRPSEDDLFDFPMLYLTGHGEIRLGEEERAALSEFLRRGGFLFAECCCGDKRFDDSFRKLASQVLPDRKLRKLPPTHEIFSAYEKVESVRYVIRSDEITERTGEPFLEGIETDGGLVVVYSKYDLGCALRRYPCFVRYGLSTDDAIKLLRNIIIYGLTR